MGFFDWAQQQWNLRNGNLQNQGQMNCLPNQSGYDPNYMYNQEYIDPAQQAMLQQQIAMQQQMMGQGMYPQAGYGGYGDMSGMYTGRTVSKKMLLDYIVASLGASEVVQCDEFETRSTRHICLGSNIIQILPVNIFNVPTPNGVVPVEIIWCANCRKLIVNRSTLEII